MAQAVELLLFKCKDLNSIYHPTKKNKKNKKKTQDLHHEQYYKTLSFVLYLKSLQKVLRIIWSNLHSKKIFVADWRNLLEGGNINAGKPVKKQLQQPKADDH
jgi:hypothetical protein